MNSYEKIKKTIEEVAGSDVSFALTPTEEIAHGDYATNVAFICGKRENISPKEYAERIRGTLLEKLSDCVSDIQIAGPGFINFFLKDETIRQENEGRSIVTKFTGMNVLVEHSSPNLFKPFSIGHLMNNFIGEFVTRATKEGGANTKTMSFPSDISLGIAKAIFILKKDIESGDTRWRDTTDETTAVNYLGECYVRGVKLSEENPQMEEEIRDISRKLYDEIDGGHRKNSEEFSLWQTATLRCKVYIDTILGSIGTHIDYTEYESNVSGRGKEIVQNNKDIFKEGDRGAVIYTPDESRKDLNTAVFINSDGHATYEAKDLALIEKKFTGGYGNFDYSYFIADNEQTHHFKIVLDAASKLGGEWPTWVARSQHITHGRMLFDGQKMSSRIGGVPLALDITEYVTIEVEKLAGYQINDMSPLEKADLWKEIALSALRISVLRSKPGININFEMEKALSVVGGSGPYLMYTHARTSSLLDKGEKVRMWGSLPATSLEKTLIHFENILEETINELAPQKLVTYLFKVAQEFNSYYGSTHILVEGDEKGNAHRLKIVERTKNVLNKGLHVLGIAAPERM